MNNKIVMLALISSSLTFSVKSNAVSTPNPWSFSASLGLLSGEAHEYVYYPRTSNKLSQLDWRIKNAGIINGELNYNFLNWLSINGRGWITLAKNKADMDDYDWFNPNQANWTDWSHHEDTQLHYANELDLSLRAWLLQKEEYKLGLAVGYQRNAFSWQANGGCYQYNNGVSRGCFSSNEPGIGYEQKFSTPYLGLAGKYMNSNFELNTFIKFSNWVSAKDHDEHYARNLTFNEWGNNSRYYAATINAGYLVTKNTKIFIEGSYNHYSNARADTEVIDNDTGEHDFNNDSAGLSNNNYTIALGLHYSF